MRRLFVSASQVASTGLYSPRHELDAAAAGTTADSRIPWLASLRRLHLDHNLLNFGHVVAGRNFLLRLCYNVLFFMDYTIHQSWFAIDKCYQFGSKLGPIWPHSETI